MKCDKCGSIPDPVYQECKRLKGINISSLVLELNIPQFCRNVFQCWEDFYCSTQKSTGLLCTFIHEKMDILRSDNSTDLKILMYVDCFATLPQLCVHIRMYPASQVVIHAISLLLLYVFIFHITSISTHMAAVLFSSTRRFFVTANFSVTALLGSSYYISKKHLVMNIVYNISSSLLDDCV